MKVKELVYQGVYSTGRGSRRYVVLDDAMWHRYHSYATGGYVYGRGKNVSGHYTEGWGVPCLVFERELDADGKRVPHGSYTREKPFLIHPKEFRGTWTEMEAQYAADDQRAKQREEQRKAENAKTTQDAHAIDAILKSFGITGVKVHESSYSKTTMSIPAEALESMLAGLQTPAQAVAHQVGAEKARLQGEHDILVTRLRNEKADEIAKYTDTIKDLLYELDVTWDEWFSGSEVVLSQGEVQ